MCAIPIAQAECRRESDRPAGRSSDRWQLGLSCCQSEGLAPCVSPAGQVIERAVVGCCPTLHLLAGTHCLWRPSCAGRWATGHTAGLSWQGSFQRFKLHGHLDADCSLQYESWLCRRAHAHPGPVIAESEAVQVGLEAVSDQECGKQAGSCTPWACHRMP